MKKKSTKSKPIKIAVELQKEVDVDQLLHSMIGKHGGSAVFKRFVICCLNKVFVPIGSEKDLEGTFELTQLLTYVLKNREELMPAAIEEWEKSQAEARTRIQKERWGCEQ